jgi:hypothetical protein
MARLGERRVDRSTRDLSLPPGLVVRTQGPLRGTGFPLDRARTAIGRDAAADVTVDDPHVSRRHAIVGRDGDAARIEDAGSRSGTFVNDVEVAGRTRLAPGDRIAVGATELVLVAHLRPDAAEAVVAAAAPAPEPARFEIDAQRAGTINNGGRDQHVHNQFVLRIGEMRRRARRLMWAGLAVMFGAVAAGVVIIASFQRDVFTCISEGSLENRCEPDFSVLAAFPIAMLAMLVGLGMLVASLVMRRRANREESRL